MRRGSPHRRPRALHRFAVLLGVFICALGAVSLSAVAGSGVLAGTSSGDGGGADDDVGYVGGPSYLDPVLDPFVVPTLVETIPVPAVEVISRRSDAPGDVIGGTDPSVSADGRYVVFTSLVQGSTAQTTVMFRDRATGEMYELTPPLAEFATRSSRAGSISADGCVVAIITTTPYDVFRDDDSGERWDVYRQQMPQCSENPDEGGGEWDLMSTSPEGGDGALNSVDPDTRLGLSAGGTMVAFRSIDLQRFGAPAPVGSVLVADATIALGSANRVLAVPGLPTSPADGQFFVSGHGSPAISYDGRYIAFTSDARADLATPTWADGPTPGGPATQQVYLWDRRGGRPKLLSAGAGGAPLANGAGQPAVSDDGREVLFVASATIDGAQVLDGSCDRCPTNVFVLDRDTNEDGVFDELGSTTMRAVSAAGGALGNGDSATPVFALGGRLAGYVTKATNLAPGAIGTAGTFVVTDIDAGTTTIGSIEAGGQRPAAVVSGWPALSQNGRGVMVATESPSVLGAAVVGTVASQVVALTATPVVRLHDVDVGTTFVNAQSERTTTLTNSGPGAFIPASISTTSSDIAISGGTCFAGVAVAAGESCTISVVVTVTELGSTSAQLIVTERGIGAVSVAAVVSGSGGVPKLTTEPPTVTYADAVVGLGGESLSVVVRNVGVGALTISTAVLAGTHPGDFVVQSDACTNKSVPESGACVVRVGFTPTTSGTRTAVLVVTAVDGSVARATLSGNGNFQPRITVAPRAVESGAPVRVHGEGFPADSDVVVAWDGERGITVHSDATGMFDVSVGTSMVTPGARQLRIADAVAAGTTPRYEAVRSEPVKIAEAARGLDATSPVFDDAGT